MRGCRCLLYSRWEQDASFQDCEISVLESETEQWIWLYGGKCIAGLLGFIELNMQL